MATFRDLLAAAKSEITEIETSEAQQRINAGGVLVLDVREPDEYEQGALPNVLHIPRGHLEAQIEVAQPIVTRKSSCIALAEFVAPLLHARCKNLGTAMCSLWQVVSESGKTRVASGVNPSHCLPINATVIRGTCCFLKSELRVKQNCWEQKFSCWVLVDWVHPPRCT